VFRIKYEEVFSYKPNADTPHLLDSLVSALAVYATAFRSKLSLFLLVLASKTCTQGCQMAKSVEIACQILVEY